MVRKKIKSETCTRRKTDLLSSNKYRSLSVVRRKSNTECVMEDFYGGLGNKRDKKRKYLYSTN